MPGDTVKKSQDCAVEASIGCRIGLWVCLFPLCCRCLKRFDSKVEEADSRGAYLQSNCLNTKGDLIISVWLSECYFFTGLMVEEKINNGNKI